ncbi:hypothetical protein AALP_AA8G005400 [Arabis alpina]|uniref:Uncharacterized protein n=1 Tax=Arabis alpina TaxID=50452 RepID=A0A087G435_ARAAL|nr:hypothetical protein AALP_AA8G005400 [Arabis alpina]
MVAPANDGEAIRQTNEELKTAYKAEEDFWKQRSRNMWLSLGDRNTGYFHAVTKGRNAVNTFSVIEDEDGVPRFKENEIVEVVVSYFTQLFTAKSTPCLQTVNEAISPKVTEDMNLKLIEDPSGEDIKLAVFAIHADKAPGPDGFSASFFHSNWDTIGTEIVPEIQEFFSNGELPKSSSHGWRGILLGRDLLKLHLGWAIGNGKDARVWNENWLSTSEQLGPIGPCTNAMEKLTVADLMMDNSTKWDLEKIHQTIPQLEEEVLVIKPSDFGAKDKRIWLKSAFGDYTTKSGYYAAQGAQQAPLIKSSLDWRNDVWSLNTAGKIKTFLWKAASGALSIGANLSFRIPGSIIPCPSCGQPETEAHLLFHCDMAAQVWELAPVDNEFQPAGIGDFDELWKTAKALSNLPPSNLGLTPLAPWLCWYIWKARNNLVFNKKKTGAADIVTMAILQAREWAQSLECKTRPNPTGKTPICEVQPCEVECHTDAAWKPDSKIAGLGWIFTSQLSNIQQSFSSALTHVASPLEAEGLAIKAALVKASENGIRSISVYTDSLKMVRAISLASKDPKLHGIVHDIISLSKRFELSYFNYIPRTANVVADSLAKNALFELELDNLPQTYLHSKNISSKQNKIPNSLDMAIVDPRFCSPNRLDMAIVRNITNDNYVITDVNGTMLFKADLYTVKGHSKDIRIFSDGSGSPVLTVKEKTMSMHDRWQVFRGQSTEQSDLLYSVKRSSMLQFKSKFDVFLSHNTEEKRCDFRVKCNRSESSRVVYTGESDTIIAQMDEKNTFKGVFVGKKDTSSVTVHPNVDYAFIASLLIILEDIHRLTNLAMQKHGRGGPVKGTDVLQLMLQ